MDRAPADLEIADDRDLVQQLALLTVTRAAPDELLTFDDVAQEYFEDPGSVRSVRERRGDEIVGFGGVIAIAPLALVVAQFVVKFLADLLATSLKDATKSSLTNALRKVLRLPSPRVEPVEFSLSQRQQIFQVAFEEGVAWGLDEGRAKTLGHSILGALDIRVGEETEPVT